MKSFGGQILFLDRSDINTDEIIPAKYLTEVERAAMGPHLLEDLKMDGFTHMSQPMQDSTVVVSRENFGCGSSREHAPWALEENGYTVVIAPNFARIFRGNMYNNGCMAIELKEEEVNEIFALSSGPETTGVTAAVDVEAQTVTIKSDKGEKTYSFDLSSYDKDLVKAGGWLEYADAKY
ncbi:MAG: 3-isopropylmalate dehydratase small subunit [Spirochaetales bacterium]|nr:3-isopropylmalate dehydratase small subunit [Spirochaetales bacterium]